MSDTAIILASKPMNMDLSLNGTKVPTSPKKVFLNGALLKKIPNIFSLRKKTL